jgi:hypothetical protein
MTKAIKTALLVAPLVLATAGAAILSLADNAKAQYCSGGICSGIHMGQRFYWKQ